MPIRYLGLDREVITETATPDCGLAFSISSPASGGKYPFASVAAGDDGRITEDVSAFPPKSSAVPPGPVEHGSRSRYTSLVMPWEAPMRRRILAVIATTATLALPTSVLAAGAPIRKPPVSVQESTPPSPPPAPLVSQTPPHQPLLGGCGGRRVRDPHTGQCRGPADVPR
jgi:hypothetical protein